MSINSSWDLDLFNPLLSGIAEDNPEIPMFLDKFTTSKDMNDRTKYPLPHKMIDSEFAGFPAASEYFEEGTPEEVHPTRGYDLETTYRTFGARISFSKIILDDDLTDVCSILVGKLRDSYAKLREYQKSAIYVRANDTTNTRYLGRDGMPMISAAHPTTGGGPNRANCIVDGSGVELNKAFGYESLQDLLRIMGRHTDLLGDPEPLRGDTPIDVAVQYEDEMEFYKILSDISLYQPSDNSNAPNVVLQASSFNSKPILDPWLNAIGSDSVQRPFFLFPDAERPIWTLERESYFGHQYLENGNLSMVHMGMGRYEYRMQDYRKVFGSGFGAS